MFKKLDDFRLKLGNKTFRPLLVGGMGVNISTAELALAAAKKGVIGHISDAMSPFLSDTMYGTKFQSGKLKKYKAQRDNRDISDARWDLSHVYEASKRYISDTMSKKVGDGAVFVNVMEKLTMGNPADTLKVRLEAALDGGIDGITLSAGLHASTLPLMKDNPRFRDAFIGIIVSSPRALKIFLRSAERVKRLPDYIIVEGPLAGGHLGFGLDWANYDLKQIVKETLEMLKESGLNIPVIPAGGVFTGTDAVEYLEMGAAAVQVATRFTISKECGLPTLIKQIYARANEEDIEVNMSSPTGYPMRMLKSSPSLRSNIRPNCEALGYLLNSKGECSYRVAYNNAPVDENGDKMPIAEKMCICSHFMTYNCYTCGHNVYRLKDTTVLLPDGNYYLPPAADIIDDYLFSVNHSIALPNVPASASKATVLHQLAVNGLISE
jgi:nitronate monooxygenase